MIANVVVERIKVPILNSRSSPNVEKRVRIHRWLSPTAAIRSGTYLCICLPPLLWSVTREVKIPRCYELGIRLVETGGVDQKPKRVCILPLHWNIYPIIDKYGEVKRLAIYSHDITEYKKAVEAVKESEEKFKALIENASDGVIIINKDGIIQDAFDIIDKKSSCFPDVSPDGDVYFLYNDENATYLYRVNRVW